MALAAIAFSSDAWAQPTITSLGSGVPQGVTNNVGGTIYIGGSGLSSAATSRWTLSGGTITPAEIPSAGGPGIISSDGEFQIGVLANTNPQIMGNTASNVAPPFSMTPTLVPSTTAPATTELAGRRWSVTANSWLSLGGLPINTELALNSATVHMMVFNSGSSGSGTGTFLSPHNMSPNGQFVVGQAYISSYSNSSGNTISASTFRWVPYVWSASTGQITVLRTPVRTSTNNWRPRTGAAYCVNNDGTVIAGMQEHNVGAAPAADPDGGRPVVWRWNSGTSQYDMTFLPNGVDASGFYYTYSGTPSSMDMNSDGTIIVGRAAADLTGNLYLAKWVWNSGTSSWDPPINLGSNLAVQASWLPQSVLSCGLPPTLGGILSMSDDGNTVVGSAVYSTCGSFMSGGFIWRSSDNLIQDWYDFQVEAGTPRIFEDFGPIGDQGDPTRGLPKLGFPSSISADGNAVVGFQGGTQIIPGAMPWVIVNSGGPACVSPVVTINPTATVNYSACTSNIILNARAAGTAPLTYQWYKDGSPLTNGLTPSGSTIEGANNFQLRVLPPLTPSDAGTYHAEISGPCGTPVVTTNAIVQVDAAFPAAPNDTCLTAQTVSTGTNVLSPAQSPCGAYVNDPVGGSVFCASNTKTDLWYVFTPVTSDNYRIETCGANFDTVLSLFDGCGGNELACNDNYTEGPSTGCTSNRSRIASIALTAATPYYIRIAAPASAFLSGTSTVNLSIFVAPAPAPNDVCTNAAPAVVGVNSLDTTEATNDWIAGCSTAQSRDVWFSYMAPQCGYIRVSTCGTSWNTVLSVYDMCGGVELACNDNISSPVPTGCGSNQSLITSIPVTAGSTYYIRVGGNSTTAFGAGSLRLALLGDCNNDGAHTFADVTPFVNNLLAGTLTLAAESADMNGDNSLNGKDVQLFLECLN